MNSIRACRRGATLAEATMAVAVVGMTFLVAAQLITAAMGQRRAQQRRVVAEQEASNLLERLMARSWDDLPTRSRAVDEESSSAIRGVLPEGQVEIEVSQEEGPPTGKRITVAVRASDTSGSPAVLARLVAWKFASPE